MPQNKRVVIVEDDVLIAVYLADICEANGFDVVGVNHQAEGAVELIVSENPDFVLLDVRLGGKRDGVDIGLAVYALAPDIKMIYVTGSNEPPSLERIRSDHPYKILIKPVLPGDVIEALT